MRPNFETMTGPELVQAYNDMATSLFESLGIQVKPVTKFRMLAVGIKRCDELQKKLAGEPTLTNDQELVEGEITAPEGETSPLSTVAFPEPDDGTTQENDDMAKKANARRAVKASGSSRGSKKAAGTGPRGSTVGGFPKEARLTLLNKENPRRGEVAKRYDFYKSCKTVGDFAEKVKNTTKAGLDLKWDVARKNIKIG